MPTRSHIRHHKHHIRLLDRHGVRVVRRPNGVRLVRHIRCGILLNGQAADGVECGHELVQLSGGVVLRGPERLAVVRRLGAGEFLPLLLALVEDRNAVHLEHGSESIAGEGEVASERGKAGIVLVFKKGGEGAGFDDGFQLIEAVDELGQGIGGGLEGTGEPKVSWVVDKACILD